MLSIEQALQMVVNNSNHECIQINDYILSSHRLHSLQYQSVFPVHQIQELLFDLQDETVCTQHWSGLDMELHIRYHTLESCTVAGIQDTQHLRLTEHQSVRS